MNWLARLKKIETVHQQGATEPTKPGCVDLICPQQVATKPTKQGYVGFVAPDMAPMQKAGSDSQAANDPAPKAPADPDRWCWPHSSAMTGREIDTIAERTHLFNRRGLPALDAELLADKLVLRDRESDDRRLCLECAHLSGRAGSMRCAQWQRAGLGAAGVPAGFHLVLQRCDGFKDQNPQRTTPS